MQTNFNYLNQYFTLITSSQIQNEKIRWIYQSAYNYFYAAYLLAQNGLKNQAHNSARMGLEFHWMGLLLKDDKKLLMNWCLGSGMSDKEYKKLQELENTTKIITKLGDNKKIKIKDRQEIYQALSDTSHVKFKNICFMGEGNKHYGHLIGGFNTEYDVRQCISAVDLCMRFVLTEVSEFYGVADFSEYNRGELHSISGSFGVDSDGVAEPHVTSKGNVGSDAANVVALLEMVANPEEFLK